jgi:Sulfotransferase family
MKRFIKSAAQTAVHGALLPLEHLLLAKHGANSRWPHIFIVGAPRSGTSLFYELIITRLQLAYFSNAAHRFFKTPAAATLLARPKIRTWSGDYSSRYGHVEGWWAPNEGGHIWRRWIDEHVGVDHAVPDDARYQDMRRTLNAISNILSAPFVNKNVMHSNRLIFMDQQFPRCVFIEIDRNPADTVRSIVRAQRNSGGPALDPANWWSVKPTLAMQHEKATTKNCADRPSAYWTTSATFSPSTASRRRCGATSVFHRSFLILKRASSIRRMRSKFRAGSRLWALGPEAQASVAVPHLAGRRLAAAEQQAQHLLHAIGSDPEENPARAESRTPIRQPGREKGLAQIDQRGRRNRHCPEQPLEA